MRKLLWLGLAAASIPTVILVFAFISLAGAEPGVGDPIAGEKKSEACFYCHGEQRTSRKSQDLPILAGQNELYLRRAMAAYANGERNNAVMKSFVSELSEQDIADIAAYYSRQKSSLR